jgi:hypothetical protein
MPLVYDSTIDIDFACEKQTNKLVMHMKALELDNSTLSLSSSNDTEFGTRRTFPWTYDPVTHFITFEFDKPFRAGFNYTFSVAFRGRTDEDEAGFYRSYYLDDDNNKRLAFS